MTSSLLRRAILPAALVASLALAACGSGDPLADTDTDTGTAAGGSADPAGSEAAAGGSGSLVVGGADFTEMRVMEEMYGALLTDAGYDVEIVSPGSREIYAQALIDGDIDVVPEYAATMAEFLNREVNGADAAVVATGDVDATVEAMRALAEQQGLVVAEPAEAASQNGYAILESVATENDITTLSDFAAFQPEIVLAATEECPTRPFCQIGLEETYGFTVTELLPLGYGSPQAKQAVVAGEADMVLVGTTDATLAADGLVLLEDDAGPPAGRQPGAGRQRGLRRGHGHRSRRSTAWPTCSPPRTLPSSTAGWTPTASSPRTSRATTSWSRVSSRADPARSQPTTGPSRRPTPRGRTGVAGRRCVRGPS